MLLTYNEEPNIERTLSQLTWADRVVVVDSYSTDRTIEIVESFENVELYYRPFDSFAQQCNFALTKVHTPWVLSLDADYHLPDAFLLEMSQKLERAAFDSYSAAFQYCVFGKPLPANNTSPRKILYKKDLAHYIDIGHQHQVQVDGPTDQFKTDINHDDRKSLSRWLRSQDKYLHIEAEIVHKTPFSELDRNDKIRKLKVIAPIVVFFYCLFIKGLAFKGWHGWHYTFQRTLVELLLSIRLIEISKLEKSKPNPLFS